MSRLRNALTTTILAGSAAAAALLTGGIASAEPAPVPVPPQIPGLSMIQSIPAIAPQLLQAFTSPPAAAPVAAPPLATASVALPGQSAALPASTGIPGLTQTLPAATGIPGLTPATTPVATTPVANEFLPAADVKLPTVPGLPVPLPQKLSFPGDLASLLPGTPSAPAIAQPGLVPSASATSPLPGVGTLFPTYALP